jgi:hypothetical protein
VVDGRGVAAYEAEGKVEVAAFADEGAVNL